MASAVRCVIEIEYGDARRAKAVHDALAPDNAGFVCSRAEGARLVAEIEGATPLQVLHTVEDYLACLGVAERAVAVEK